MVLIIKKKIKNISPQISLHRAEDYKESRTPEPSECRTMQKALRNNIKSKNVPF